jgi:hypothetical protein
LAEGLDALGLLIGSMSSIAERRELRNEMLVIAGKLASGGLTSVALRLDKTDGTMQYLVIGPDESSRKQVLAVHLGVGEAPCSATIVTFPGPRKG